MMVREVTRHLESEVGRAVVEERLPRVLKLKKTGKNHVLEHLVTALLYQIPLSQGPLRATPAQQQISRTARRRT